MQQTKQQDRCHQCSKQVYMRMKIFTRLVLLGSLTVSATFVLSCPVEKCQCIPSTQTIDCQYKGLTAIPKITPSDQVFQEITFENSADSSDESYSDLSNLNRISNIPADTFRGLRVKKINLGNAGVRTLDQRAFSGLETVLEHLVIGGVRVLSPPLDSLQNLKNLTKLELQNYKVPVLRKSFAISSLLRLQSLKLINMKMFHVSENALENFNDLRHLEISGNKQIRFYPATAIWKVPKLEELVFKENGLVKVAAYSFYELANLKSLDLSRNDIETLSPDAFQGVSKRLESIDLTGNALTTDSLSTFSKYNWQNMKNLRLLLNKITRIPKNMFSKMKNLESLELQLNSISEVITDDFRPLVRLENLDLSYNLITNIQANALDLPSIKTLRLSNLNKNKVGTITGIKNAFNGTKMSLDLVDLKENRFNTTDLWREIGRLTTVQELDISDTGLNDLPESVFAKNEKIRKLDINNNNIGPIISASSFNGLQTTLQQLQLVNNGIRTMDSCIFEEFPQLKLLTLYGNPLKCDCKLSGLQTWMKSLGMFYSFIVQAQCAYPPPNEGKMLASVTLGNDANPCWSPSCPK